MGVPIIIAVQSVAVLQPIQSPLLLVVSQMGVLPWQSALVAQAAWHVWSPGQHAGVAAGQSESDRHSAQAPVATTHLGAVAGHTVLDVQSTQPRVPLQVWPARQWTDPFTPHNAEAPAPLLEEEPPQATPMRRAAARAPTRPCPLTVRTLKDRLTIPAGQQGRGHGKDGQ